MAESLNRTVEPPLGYTERRRKARREFVDQLRVCDAVTSVRIGRLSNLTSSGMLLRTEFPVRAGKLLSVHIQLPEVRDGRSRVDISMQCRWCHPVAGGGGFEAGFRFVNTTFRQKHLLETFLADAFPAEEEAPGD